MTDTAPLAARLEKLPDELVGPTSQYLALMVKAIDAGVPEAPQLADTMLTACRYDQLALVVGNIAATLYAVENPEEYAAAIAVNVEQAALEQAITELSSLVDDLGHGEPTA